MSGGPEATRSRRPWTLVMALSASALVGLVALLARWRVFPLPRWARDVSNVVLVSLPIALFLTAAWRARMRLRDSDSSGGEEPD
jgi:hypothetical protein